MSLLPMGTPGKIFPQYCLHLTLAFWNLAQDKLHGLRRALHYWLSQPGIQDYMQFTEG